VKPGLHPRPTKYAVLDTGTVSTGDVGKLKFFEHKIFEK
jgi:hypothetical protein